MNTYERHRLYRLRRHRSRILRRRMLALFGTGILLLFLWGGFARWGPEDIAPPRPSVLGAQAAQQIAHGAATSINTVHAQIRPESRSGAKNVALTLFESAGMKTNTPTRGLLPQGRVHSARTVVAADDALLTALTGKGRLVRSTDSPLPTTAVDSRHRELDVLLIGLDSRLGAARGRADALHLLTIDLDAPSMRITSIPRGTWSDLGYENEASNIIANVRAARGRKELLRRVARLCRRDSVPCFIEIGFSDAFGILELLGYADPSSELQALRHREGYQFGDHNRCYNQGMFIRSSVLKLLPLLEGITGEMLVRAGRDLVSTNLTLEQCRGIAYLLNDAGLALLPENIMVHLRSRFRERIERSKLGSSYADVERGVDYRGMGGSRDVAEFRIRKALGTAIFDTALERRLPEKLWTLFQQHAWLQIPDHATRRQLRDSLARRLLVVCALTGDETITQEINRTVRADDVLFHQIRALDRTAAALSSTP